jgi:hypothetical protein
MTTFMLNFMASSLNEEFEFVPYTVSRLPKKDVIANYGYGAILRGGIMRALNSISDNLAAFPVSILPSVLEN